jgi:hypothetical protein
MLYTSLYLIIIASFTIITYYTINKINTNQLKSDNSDKLINVYNDIQTCKLFYTNNSKNIKHKIVKLLTNEQCAEYLNSFLIDVEKLGGFEIDRHKNYPTTDKMVTEEWETFPKLKILVNDKIIKIFAKMFKIPDFSSITVQELFFVKYEYSKNAQKHLDIHQDGSEMSFVIALNDTYTDGGTHFIITDEHVKLNIGECVFFSGKQYHQGMPITSGIRYILTGFLNYKTNETCSNVLRREFETNTGRKL